VSGLEGKVGKVHFPLGLMWNAGTAMPGIHGVKPGVWLRVDCGPVTRNANPRICEIWHETIAEILPNIVQLGVAVWLLYRQMGAVYVAPVIFVCGEPTLLSNSYLFCWVASNNPSSGKVTAQRYQENIGRVRRR
jgi:hypothetical protein